MKIKKEGSENNPRFKLMEGGITLKEIEKWYGKETALSLVKYCDEMEMEIEDVAGDDKAWDKFERWAKSKKRGIGTSSGKFDNWHKASKIDDRGDGPRATTRYDMPVSSDIYGESSEMDEQSIIDFIAEEMNDCDWVGEFDFDDYEPILYLTMTDGTKFKVVVSKDEDEILD